MIRIEDDIFNEEEQEENRILRNNTLDKFQKINQLVKTIPNDQELGAKIRKLLNENK